MLYCSEDGYAGLVEPYSRMGQFELGSCEGLLTQNKQSGSHRLLKKVGQVDYQPAFLKFRLIR